MAVQLFFKEYYASPEGALCLVFLDTLCFILLSYFLRNNCLVCVGVFVCVWVLFMANYKMEGTVLWNCEVNVEGKVGRQPSFCGMDDCSERVLDTQRGESSLVKVWKMLPCPQAGGNFIATPCAHASSTDGGKNPHANTFAWFDLRRLTFSSFFSFQSRLLVCWVGVEEKQGTQIIKGYFQISSLLIILPFKIKNEVSKFRKKTPELCLLS